PRGNVNDDAARFDRTMQNRRTLGTQKRQHAAGKMQPMHGGKNVHEGTAGTAGEVKTSGGKLAPDKKLSRQKQETENGSQAEPWEVALVAQRDAGHRLHRRKRGFP